MRLSIVQRHKSRGIKTWYLRTFDEKTGAVSYKSLDTTRKHEAETALAKAQAERYAPPSERENSAAPLITPEQAAERYLEAAELMKERPQTLANKKTILKRFLGFCFREQIADLTAINTEQAARLIQPQGDEKASTTAKRLRQYRAFYTWLFDTIELDKVNPFKRVRAPKEERAPRAFWTVEQLITIIGQESSPERRLFYAFQAWAGLRFEEARALTWENIEAGPDSFAITVLKGKGGKTARLPMGPRMRAAIGAYLNGSEKPQAGAIFSKIGCNPTENRKLKENIAAAGITASGPIHCHRFRHSFASNLLRAGAGIVETSKLMRHDSVNITLKYYAHCLPDDMEKALNLL